MRLKDRVAIVVGAGQSPGEGIGNGRATALTFAREGAKVLCVDHNLASAQETVDMIAAKEGTAAAFKADVTKNTDLKAMVEDAKGRWGRIDVLHNNVGVSLSGGDAELLEISEEAFDRCVAINLKSCVLAAKHVVPIMRAQKSGAIINISSISRAGNVGQTNYSAAKAGVAAATVTWAKELARYGIRVAGIAPGFIETEMTLGMKPEALEKMTSGIPLKRMGKPEEIAHSAAYIFENDYYNGRIMELDGGLRI